MTSVFILCARAAAARRLLQKLKQKEIATS